MTVIISVDTLRLPFLLLRRWDIELFVQLRHGDSLGTIIRRHVKPDNLPHGFDSSRTAGDWRRASLGGLDQLTYQRDHGRYRLVDLGEGMHDKLSRPALRIRTPQFKFVVTYYYLALGAYQVHAEAQRVAVVPFTNDRTPLSYTT